MPVKQRNQTTSHGTFVVGWLGSMEAHTCGTCGVTWAMPRAFLDARREDGQWWYCPNQHGWRYSGENEEERLKRMLDSERDRSARLSANLDQTKASASALKGVVTKQRKKLERVANGVCPCCNRSFADLRKHIATKHPGYDGQPQ